MRASPASTQTKLAAKHGPDTGSLEDLVRLLVKRVSANNGHCLEIPYDMSAEEIILDTEIDGGRYLLVRLPKPAQSQVRLSPREQEIVRMVAQGHSNKIIADVLNISSWTVCTHLRRVFGKLGVGSRAAMVARLPQIARTCHAGEPIPSSSDAGLSRPTPRSPLYESHRLSPSFRGEAVARRSG
jgi:DNA-binding CsgD family transcriptional regulator